MHRRVCWQAAHVVSFVLLLVPASRVEAQRATEAHAHPRLSLTLAGGWASFAHSPVNRSIRLDNYLLTAPVDSGGVGLSKGLDEIADGLGLSAEVRWRMGEGWGLSVGLQRLYDRSRVSFTYDPGTGPESGYMEYVVEGLPLHAGVYREWPFTERLTYRLGGALLYFPSSRLRVSGRIGGLAALQETGTADGIGAMFNWGGSFRLNESLSLEAGVRLRLGRIGDPVDDDGDVIQTTTGMELAPMDWSGVDIVLGITYGFF